MIEYLIFHSTSWNLIKNTADNILYFLVVDKAHESSIVVMKAWNILFLCVMELYWCPNMIKNTPVSQTVGWHVTWTVLLLDIDSALECTEHILYQFPLVPNISTVYYCIYIFFFSQLDWLISTYHPSLPRFAEVFICIFAEAWCTLKLLIFFQSTDQFIHSRVKSSVRYWV